MGGSNQSSECCICIRRFLPPLPMRRRLLFEFISDPTVRPKQLHSTPMAHRPCACVDRRCNRERRRGVFDIPCIDSFLGGVHQFSMTRLLSFTVFVRLNQASDELGLNLEAPRSWTPLQRRN